MLSYCYRLWLRQFPEDLLGGRPTYDTETRQRESIELPSLAQLPDFIAGWLEAHVEVGVLSSFASGHWSDLICIFFFGQVAAETVKKLSKDHTRRFLRERKSKLIEVCLVLPRVPLSAVLITVPCRRSKIPSRWP